MLFLPSPSASGGIAERMMVTRMAGIFQSSLVWNSMRTKTSCFLPKLPRSGMQSEGRSPPWSSGSCPCQPHRFMTSLRWRPRWQQGDTESVESVLYRAAATVDDAGVFVSPSGQRETPEEIWSRQGDKLIIVDGKAVVYRAYYSAFAGGFSRAKFMDDLNPVHNQLDTFFTVINSINILALLLELQPTHMLVTFDAAGKNFRHSLLPSYKAKRPQTPDAVREALDVLKKIVLPSMGIQMLEVNGVEADDVIGTMTVRAESAGMEVGIASPDKDFYQLLSDNVQCFQPKPRGPGIVVFGLKNFRTKYNGIEPSQFVDALALIGDTVDNVEGILGFGTQRATKLIKEHGSLETLLANAASVKQNGLRKGLEEDGAKARLAKNLVTLRTNLPSFMVPVDLRDLRLSPPLDGGKSFEGALQALDMHVEFPGVPKLKQRMQHIWKSYQ